MILGPVLVLHRALISNLLEKTEKNLGIEQKIHYNKHKWIWNPSQGPPTLCKLQEGENSLNSMCAFKQPYFRLSKEVYNSFLAQLAKKWHMIKVGGKKKTLFYLVKGEIFCTSNFNQMPFKIGRSYILLWKAW